MASPRPKPTALKLLAGKPGHHPLNKAEPRPGKPDIRVPNGKLPKQGQQLWRVLAGQLEALGVLKSTDLVALEILCLHYAVVRMAFETIESEGLTAETGQSGLKKHPAAGIFRENSAAFKSYLIEFGLTPSSRVKIKAEPAETEKTLADLLFEGVEEGKK